MSIVLVQQEMVHLILKLHLHFRIYNTCFAQMSSDRIIQSSHRYIVQLVFP